MAVNFTYTLHDNYLEMQVAGRYDYDAAIREFAVLLDMAHDEKTQKVLVDYRELEHIGGDVEKILYTFKAEEIYRSYLTKTGMPLRLAYLAPSIESEPGADIGRKVPGLEFEIFADKNEAMRWLLFNV